MHTRAIYHYKAAREGHLNLCSVWVLPLATLLLRLPYMLKSKAVFAYCMYGMLTIHTTCMQLCLTPN